MHLNLGFCSPDINIDVVCNVLKTYNKNIKSVDFWKTSVTQAGLIELSELSELEEVELGWCLREINEPGESLKLLIQKCRKLKKLFLAAIRGLQDSDLENISKYCVRNVHSILF